MISGKRTRESLLGWGWGKIVDPLRRKTKKSWKKSIGDWGGKMERKARRGGSTKYGKGRVGVLILT